MDNFNTFFESENIENSKEIGYDLGRKLSERVFEMQSRYEPDEFNLTFEGMPLSDVNSHLSTLSNQISILRNLHIDNFPVLRLGNGYRLPIDIIESFSNNDYNNDTYYFRNFFDSPYFYDQMHYWIRSFSERSNSDLELISFSELHENLIENLKKFLTYRHAALFNTSILEKIKEYFTNTPPQNSTTGGKNNGGPPSGGNPNQYLKITVHTEGHHGLTVSAAPAFFASWRKFGSPSSPVTGQLLPGTYIFGAKGLSLPKFKKDSVPVDIPPKFDFTINL